MFGPSDFLTLFLMLVLPFVLTCRHLIFSTQPLKWMVIWKPCNTGPVFTFAFGYLFLPPYFIYGL